MPSLNGMGPSGAGPMTGRAMGRCGRGRAMGQGRRMTMGRNQGHYSVPDLKEQEAMLKQELEYVQEQMKQNEN